MSKYEKIFGAYDIRGVFPKDLDVAFAYKLGRSFVSFMNVSEVLVGYDGRSSSKKLFENLVKGIIDQGANVINIGLCSTPTTYFAMIQGKYESGIMITASHNPKNYNGFKLLGKGAQPIHQENGSLNIMKLVSENNFSKVKKGKLKKKDWSKEYLKNLKTFMLIKSKQKTKPKELKLVVDQSNGSGFVEVELIKKLFPNTKLLNNKISGTFPGHEPNPLKQQNRKQLVAAVKKSKADLGIIFDGDADRVCFIDEKGNFIRPDLILLLFLDKMKKGTIVYEVRSSKYIAEKAESKGIHAILSKAGRTNIVEVMKNNKAEIGGEGSGHYFFKDFKYMDSSGIAVLKVLNELLTQKEEDKKTFSELTENLSPYVHSGEINLRVKNISKAFLLIEHGFMDANKILFLDGLSIYYDDYWFNIRKSNTEPLLRINAEAKSKEKLDILIGKITKLMKLIK